MNDCDITELQGSSLGSDLSRVIRYMVTAIGGYLVGKGYLQDDTVQAVAAVATTATPIIIGTIIGRMNRKKVTKVIEAVRAEKSNGGE